MDLIAQVRALIGDDTDPYDYMDEQIQVLLNLNEDNVLITSAVLLERTAAIIAVKYMSVRTDDLSVDGKSAAALLMARAKALRDEDALASDNAVSDYFEIVYPFGNCPVVPEGTTRPFSWG